MGNLIPFFRYDILARIIPGAFTLFALAYAGVEVPLAWHAIFEGGASAGAKPGSAVVLPLIYAGVCYAVGVFYEVAFATQPLKLIGDLIIRKAYDRAKGEKNGEKRTASPDRTEQYRIWNDLVHKDAGKGERFAHAHRFQAEAKMCLHSVIPALLLVVFAYRNWLAGGCSQQAWEFIIASLLLFVLCWGAYAREWRRWLQALIAKDYS